MTRQRPLSADAKRPPTAVRHHPPFPLEDGPGAIGGRSGGMMDFAMRTRQSSYPQPCPHAVETDGLELQKRFPACVGPLWTGSGLPFSRSVDLRE
jgi:hypothetical protein